jgi:hypothetical protein
MFSKGDCRKKFDYLKFMLFGRVRWELSTGGLSKVQDMQAKLQRPQVRYRTEEAGPRGASFKDQCASANREAISIIGNLVYLGMTRAVLVPRLACRFLISE